MPMSLTDTRKTALKIDENNLNYEITSIDKEETLKSHTQNLHEKLEGGNQETLSPDLDTMQ